MKSIFNYSLLLSLLIIVMVACQDKNINVFDKTPDERSAAAIADLKQKLTAPANGWKLKYQPDSASGYYYVLLNFDDDNKVRIRTDFNAQGGKFYDQTITYRIDNSLGVQLVMESYCFFSYLFEQYDASYPAEYEFIYTNETANKALVFKSKTDVGNNPTVLTFEQAASTDASLLGNAIAMNLDTLSHDINMFSSSLALTFVNKDLILYASLDDFQRTINFTAAVKKSYALATKVLNFSAGYVIKGDSIVFDAVLQDNILGNSIAIKSLQLNSLNKDQLNVCAGIPLHSYSGVTSQGDQFNLETSLLNIAGKSFATAGVLSGPVYNIFNNGMSVEAEIMSDFPNGVELQLYYNYKLPDGSILNAFGIVIQNIDGTTTFALWEFMPTLTNNNLVFNFYSDVSVFGSPTDEDVESIKKYIGPIAQVGTTYVFKLNETAFEFYNPCTQWSAVLFAEN